MKELTKVSFQFPLSIKKLFHVIPFSKKKKLYFFKLKPKIELFLRFPQFFSIFNQKKVGFRGHAPCVTKLNKKAFFFIIFFNFVNTGERTAQKASFHYELSLVQRSTFLRKILSDIFIRLKSPKKNVLFWRCLIMP